MWHYLYLVYDPTKFDSSCSLSNERIEGLSIGKMNCEAVTTTDKHGVTRYYYKIGVGTVGAMLRKGQADYFNFGIKKENTWGTMTDVNTYYDDCRDDFGAGIPSVLPEELNFAFSVDISFGSTLSIQGLHIGKGKYECEDRTSWIYAPSHVDRDNWWIASLHCSSAGLTEHLSCPTVTFSKSLHDSPEHVPDNVIQITPS